MRNQRLGRQSYRHSCSTRLPAQKIFGLSISSQRERMAPCNLVGRGRLQILRIFAHTGAFKTIASVSIKRVNACDIAAVIGSRYGGNIPSSSGVRGQLRHALTANLGTLRNLKDKNKTIKTTNLRNQDFYQLFVFLRLRRWA